MKGGAAGPLWGALFDWDGVIVDTRDLHEAAWNRVAREFGFPHGPEDFKRHFGSQNRRAITEILGWTSDEDLVARISDRKEALYRESVRVGDLLLPGALEFLTLLESRGVPRAVVSSSPRANIEPVLGALALGARFERIIAAEDAPRSKPDPQGYRLGAEAIGVAPARCVVFEDAPAGIEAGRRGGMRVVGLTTTHPPSALAGADLVVTALDAEVLARIEDWFRER